MSKEMFEQWTQLGKNSFKPMVEFNTLIQDYVTKITKKVSGEALEQINANVKILQSLPNCKKPEDFSELNNKLTKGTLEGMLNLAQDTLDTQMELFTRCSEWFENQYAALSETQAKAAKATKAA